jgi:O-antigen ligase
MRSLANLSARVAAAVAAGGFLALIYSLHLVEGTTFTIITAFYLFAAFAAAMPGPALMLVAGLVPIASWLGRSTNEYIAWAEAIVVAFAAGYCARVAATRTDRPSSRIGPPVFVMAVVVGASVLMQIFVEVWRFGPAPTQEKLWGLLTHYYFVTYDSADPIDAGMRLIESLILLGAAASLAQRHPRFSRWLLHAIVFGAAAAAALNLWRLWEATQRLNRPLDAFLRYLSTQRLNVHYGDLNAAGSYFVMMLFAAVGLSLVPKQRRWIPAVAVIAASTWLTGSRSAMLAGVLALLLPTAAYLYSHAVRSRTRTLAIGAAAVVLSLVVGAGAALLPQRGNQQSAGMAATVRWEMAQTSLRMTASRPSFGVGIGSYYARSGEFASRELLQIFPPAVHENAHNNFFQILAELGIVGLAVFLWLLVKAAMLCVGWIRADPRDPVRWGTATGLLAFVLSWLGGHPLLIDEPAFSFWLLLGTACGSGAWVASPEKTARIRWIIAGAFLVIAVSVPFRVEHQRADFNLEHRGIGLSVWEPALDGVRFRVGGSASTVFMPADAAVVTVPLRAANAHETLTVSLYLDDRPANVVAVPGDRWTHLPLLVPQNTSGAKFRRLDLRVKSDAPTTPNVLLVGKVEPR